MTTTRTIRTPVDVDPCDCGARLVLETVDGISRLIECTDCDTEEPLADLILGAEP